MRSHNNLIQKPIIISSLFFLSSIFLAGCGDGTAPLLPPTETPLAMACQPVTVEPTPGPEEAVFPPVTSSDHLQGPANAPVTILVYSDFQSQTCAALASMLKTLRADHADDLRIAYRYMPLEKNNKSALAARAAEAASRQNKFWEMHDLLYGKQADWIALDPDDFEPWIAEQAESLGLNREKFLTDMSSEAVMSIVQQAVDLAAEVPLPPLLIINNRLQSGMVNYYSLDTTIRLIALGERQISTCPPIVIDPHKQYFATLHTEKGEVIIQLYTDKAPLTVNNFVFLARNGWFDNITFDRVIPGSLVQTGDPSGTGMGNPGYFIPNEPVASLRFDKAGVVGMDNFGPNLNGSQFFITLGPAPDRDGMYTIFGQVLSGLDVLAQLTPRDPQPGIWFPPGDKLISVTIEEK